MIDEPLKHILGHYMSIFILRLLTWAIDSFLVKIIIMAHILYLWRKYYIWNICVVIMDPLHGSLDQKTYFMT